MPYLNSLAKRYGMATQYYANTHPSIGNYFMVTTGQIITNEDLLCGSVTQDNIVRYLLTAGKTWRSYAESLPNIIAQVCLKPALNLTCVQVLGRGQLAAKATLFGPWQSNLLKTCKALAADALKTRADFDSHTSAKGEQE